MSYEGQVQTIRAQAGKNPGECVGSFGRCLVFLPRGCEPEREYRVRLDYASKDAKGEPRLDKAGRPLYRGTPAPDETSERWVENKDGTVSRSRVVKNWKLEEKLHPIETRAKVRKDGQAIVSATFTHDFGTGLGDARVTVTTKTEIPEMEETVDLYDGGSRLTTRVVARRDGGTKVQTFAVESVEAIRSGYIEANDWLSSRTRFNYAGEPDLHIRLKISPAGMEPVQTNSWRFAELPDWLQTHLSAPYPPCACGRQRVDTPAGHRECAKCRAAAAQHAVIEAALPAEKRVEFAKVAALCDAAASEGKAFEGENGGDLMIALTSHRRPEDLDAWKGYLWYYLTSDGVFASRFPPEAMMILTGLSGATGRGLVTLVSWLTAEHLADRCADDFYARTQVRGENVEARVDQYVIERACVAVKLRGSEADRQAAVAALENLRSKLGESSSHVRVVDGILQAEEQDYGTALARAREAEAAVAQAALVRFGGYFRRMGATGNADYFVVRADGSLRDPDSYVGRRRWESSEGDKTWELVGNDELALVWSKHHTAAAHVFEVAHRPATLSEAQRETVLRIEEEVVSSGYQGCGSGSASVVNTWADQLGLRVLVAGRDVAIAEALRRSRIIGRPPSVNSREAARREGVWVNEQDLRVNAWNCSFPNRDPDDEFDRGREKAWILETIPAADGVVEVLTVERWRQDRPEIRYRWRPRRAGEPTAPALTPTPPKGSAVEVSKLDLSGLFGGAANVKKKK